MLLLSSLIQELSGSTGADSALSAAPRGCTKGHRHQWTRQVVVEAAEPSVDSTHMHEVAGTAGVERGGGLAVAVAESGAEGAAKAIGLAGLLHH